MSKKFSRRDFLGLAAATGAGAVLAACAPSAKPTVSGSQAQQPEAKATVPPAASATLNMWGWTDLINTEVVNTFTKQNSNIKVNLTELGENVFGDQKFLTAVAAGTGPDVAIQNRHTFMQFSS